MELRHLRYLVAVAEADTFGGAAEAIRVAQPALTRQLHDLEHDLGVTLFEKGARRATLTKAGEACARLARHVIRDTEKAMTRARLSDEGLAGDVALIAGVIPLASGLAGRLLARLKTRYPGINLVVEEGDSADMWDRVVSGKADIALSVAPPAKFPSLSVEFQMPDVVEDALMNADHPMAARGSVTIAELSIFPALMLGGTMGTVLDAVQRQYIQMVAKLGRGEPVTEIHETVHALLSHTRAMQGWMFVPKSIRSKYSPLVPVPVRDFRMPLVISRIWRRADDRPLIRTVISELRQMEQEDRDAAPAEQKRGPKPGKSRAPVPARLELRHLRSFAEVARYGSFGRAAEALEITQPALSRQMKDLEYDVGVALFERGARGVELTPAGQAFRADVDGVLTIVESMKKEARRAERGATQQCLIGVVPHEHMDRLVADLVVQVESRADRVNVTTRILGTPSMAPALRRSEIDLALAFAYPIRVPPDLDLIRVRLFDDEMSYALLAPSHPLAKAKSLSAADLADVPFLFPGRETFPPVHSVVMHEFNRVGVSPRVDNTYEGVVTIWAVAAQGLGWALGLREQAKDPPMGLVSIPLTDFRLPWGGELIYRKDESRAAILSIVDTIVARARELFTLSGPLDTPPSTSAVMPQEQ